VSRRVLGLLVAASCVAALAAAAPVARAADECRGLDVCLPVEGPWVVIPAPAKEQPTSTVVWELRCPLEGYIIGGTDARVSDPAIDVSIRGATGSPIAPGVTTSERVFFTAVYTGTARRVTTFRPFIGCIPTQGGGGRALTSYSQSQPGPPGTPLERRVVQRRFLTGRTRTATAACRPGERLVGASHAIGFQTDLPPGDSIRREAKATRTVSGTRVTVRGTASAQLPRGLAVEIQAHALCAKGGK
jgi:hypothetical protein